MRTPKGFKAVVIGTDRDSSKNYMAKVMDLAKALPKGAAYEVQVAHDADCPAINGGGYCACDPDVRLIHGEAAAVPDADGATFAEHPIGHRERPAPQEGPLDPEGAVSLAIRLGRVLEATKTDGATLVVDRDKNMVRCEFSCWQGSMVNLMVAAWSAAILQFPDDRKAHFMQEVLQRVDFSLFDPRGDLYRPYGSDGSPERSGR